MRFVTYKTLFYEYSKNECGTVSENNIYAKFRAKYDHPPKRQLKRALFELKSKNKNTDENKICCFKVDTKKIYSEEDS